MEFFTEFIKLMTGKIWNRKTVKVAVWKAPSNKSLLNKRNTVEAVQLYNYTFDGVNTKEKIK